MRSLKLVIFDLDGVLVDTQSSWVHVHKHFGVDNDEAYYAYMRKEMDYAEFMRKDIVLWLERKPIIHTDELKQVLSTLPLVPGAREFLDLLQRSGIERTIVSCGIDLLANRAAEELGISSVHANGLEVDDFGNLTGEGIARVTLLEKGAPIPLILNKLQIEPEEAVAIGNSGTDSLMFAEVGLGIAFDPTDDHVRNKADIVIEEKDLMQVVPALEERGYNFNARM